MATTTTTELTTASSVTFTELNVRQDKGKPHFIRLHDSVVKGLERHLLASTADSSGLLLGGIDLGENCTISVEDFEPAAKIDESDRSKSARNVVGYYRTYGPAEFAPDASDRSFFQRSFPKDARVVLLVRPPKGDVGTAMFFLGENGQLTSDHATVEFPFNLRALGAEDPSPAAAPPAAVPVLAKPASSPKPVVTAKPASPAAKPVAPAPVVAAKPAAPAPVVAAKPAVVPVAAAKPAAAAPAKPAPVAPIAAPGAVVKPATPASPAPGAVVKPATPASPAPATALVAAKPTPAPVIASKSPAPAAAAKAVVEVKPSSGGSFWKIAVAGVVVVGSGLGLNSLGVFNRQSQSPVVLENPAPVVREAEPTPSAQEPESTPPSKPKQETPKAAPIAAAPSPRKITPAETQPAVKPIEVRRTPPAPVVESTPPQSTAPRSQPTATAQIPESRPVTPPPATREQNSEPTPTATRPAPTPSVQSAAPVDPAKQYTAPRAIRQFAPVMVDNVRRSIEGEMLIKVRAFVDATGKVTHIEPITGGSQVANALAITAINAVRRWQFEPARRGDEKVSSEVELSFTFRK